MSTSRVIADALAPIVDFIYPPRCPACGAGVGEQGGLCAQCWDDLVIPSEPCCAACQRPFASASSDGSALCGPCLATRPVHDGIAAGTLYTETSRKLVLALKHGGRIALAPMLARLIAARLPTANPRRLIVPVPLHRRRLWSRGYNQAGLLARELGRFGHGIVLVDALVRTRSTPTLGGLGKRERAKVLAGALAVRGSAKERIKGAEIILVDDVLTSGATSSACVAALKRAGATRVTIACFARVLDEALDTARGSKG
ncbi:ComF family protein [Erythrobacter mangrovi]|uniref:ComF family protein n=2 Tax=Erythrobacter mangrovi TaxID=2739433 RepID=A0A7D3XKK0_9SPHN|nr:ComF family protein [Erythrobacter mangrovi]